MFNNITYYPILGLPLIMWGGLFTLSCFLIAAAIPMLIRKFPKKKIPFKLHTIFARIGIVLALIHGSLGILSRF